MKKIDSPLKIIFLIVFLFSLFSAINIFTPVISQFESLNKFITISQFFLSLISFFIFLIVYGLFGFFGYKLSKKLNLPIFSEGKIKKKLLIKSILFGILIGIILIILEQTLIYFFHAPKFPKLSFPFSVLGSVTSILGEEIFYHLFLISFLLFIFEKIFKKKEPVFFAWNAIILSGIFFTFIHLPNIMFFFNTINFPIIFLVELVLINFLIIIPSGYFFIRYGLFYAILLRFFIDLVWNILYGFF